MAALGDHDNLFHHKSLLFNEYPDRGLPVRSDFSFGILVAKHRHLVCLWKFRHVFDLNVAVFVRDPPKTGLEQQEGRSRHGLP